MQDPKADRLQKAEASFQLNNMDSNKDVCFFISLGKGFCLRCSFLMLRDLDSDLRGLSSWSFLRTAVFHKFKKLDQREIPGDKVSCQRKKILYLFFICSNPACLLKNSELLNNCICFRAFWRSEGLFLFICFLLVWGFFCLRCFSFNTLI